MRERSCGQENNGHGVEGEHRDVNTRSLPAGAFATGVGAAGGGVGFLAGAAALPPPEPKRAAKGLALGLGASFFGAGGGGGEAAAGGAGALGLGFALSILSGTGALDGAAGAAAWCACRKDTRVISEMHSKYGFSQLTSGPFKFRAKPGTTHQPISPTSSQFDGHYLRRSRRCRRRR